MPGGPPTPVIPLGKPGTAAPATPTCTDSSGLINLETISTTVLVEKLIVDVYTPPCYRSDGDSKRLPMLVLLQGLGLQQNQWLDIGVASAADNLIASKKIPPFIMVIPRTDEDANDNSKFVYSSGGADSWEDYVIRDVLPTIYEKYYVRYDSAGRGIGGISRGGYWSLEIGMRHPEEFGSIGGHSPAISNDMLIGVPEGFNMISMLGNPDDARGQRFYLDAGDEDPMQYAIEQLGQEFNADKIENTVKVNKGGHVDAYWQAHVAEYLEFYAAAWK